jgi:peptide/nickel transport system permease protein
MVAVLSRMISLVVGLLAGYQRRLDRPRTDVRSTTPSSSVPLFPILVLFYFVLRNNDVDSRCSR